MSSETARVIEYADGSKPFPIFASEISSAKPLVNKFLDGSIDGKTFLEELLSFFRGGDSLKRINFFEGVLSRMNEFEGSENEVMKVDEIKSFILVVIKDLKDALQSEGRASRKALELIKCKSWSEFESLSSVDQKGLLQKALKDVGESIRSLSSLCGGGVRLRRRDNGDVALAEFLRQKLAGVKVRPAEFAKRSEEPSTLKVFDLGSFRRKTRGGNLSPIFRDPPTEGLGTASRLGIPNRRR